MVGGVDVFAPVEGVLLASDWREIQQRQLSYNREDRTMTNMLYMLLTLIE